MPRLGSLLILTLVHDAAVEIVDGLDQQFPTLSFDTDAVLFGAASHDLGKMLHPHELRLSNPQIGEPEGPCGGSEGGERGTEVKFTRMYLYQPTRRQTPGKLDKLTIGFKRLLYKRLSSQHD